MRTVSDFLLSLLRLGNCQPNFRNVVNGWPASTTEVLHWTRTGEQSIFVYPTLGQEMGKGGDNETVEEKQRRTKKHRSNRVWTRKIDASSLNEAARMAAETARGSFERDSAINS